jgi:hypothetical protein
MVVPQKAALLIPRLLLLFLGEPRRVCLLRGYRGPGTTKRHKAGSAVGVGHGMLSCIWPHRRSFGGALVVGSGVIAVMKWPISICAVETTAFCVVALGKVSGERLLSYWRGREVGGAEGRPGYGRLPTGLCLYRPVRGRHCWGRTQGRGKMEQLLVFREREMPSKKGSSMYICVCSKNMCFFFHVVDLERIRRPDGKQKLPANSLIRVTEGWAENYP